MAIYPMTPPPGIGTQYKSTWLVVTSIKPACNTFLRRCGVSPVVSGVYGAKKDIHNVTADDMLAVYSVNCVGPLLVVQQLLEAGLIGGLGGKTLVGNVSSKVGAH
jgi:hypothetical protein